LAILPGLALKMCEIGSELQLPQFLEAIALKGFIFVAVGEKGTWGSQEVSKDR
jgi:hypothetical protein